jgi:putative ABC transport system permease protein
MNLFRLVWSYLTAKPLNTILNTVLLALGIAVITLLLLFSNQLNHKITENSKGIDLVVGAKGSPLQLILCNIFHTDFPTGNIKLNEAERLIKHPLIKKAIPMALGDSYLGFRIIGTNRGYATLYNAQLALGSWWKNDLEVTLGATVAESLKLKPGDTFASAHGLSEGGHLHEENVYIVKGILKSTGKVLDNLILTNVGSVWKVHEEEEEQEHHEEPESEKKITNPSSLVPTAEAADSTKEITSLLLQYRNPLAAIQFPRYVNSKSNMQAASPTFETARLFSILGVGVDIIIGFAYVLICISGLSIFIALYNSLKERQYDMAIMRSMGASRSKIFCAILLEGSILTFQGSMLGLLFGHLALLGISALLVESQQAGVSAIIFYSEEWLILVGGVLLGIVCSLLPALQAYRTEIHTVLASNQY